MSLQKVPDEIIEALCLEVRSLLLDHPYKECRKLLWKFVASTIYHGENRSSAKESSEALYFYERLKGFLKELNRLDKKIQQYTR
jgi:hypothetical protein